MNIISFIQRVAFDSIFVQCSTLAFLLHHFLVDGLRDRKRNSKLVDLYCMWKDWKSNSCFYLTCVLLQICICTLDSFELCNNISCKFYIKFVPSVHLTKFWRQYYTTESCAINTTKSDRYIIRTDITFAFWSSKEVQA